VRGFEVRVALDEQSVEDGARGLLCVGLADGPRDDCGDDGPGEQPGEPNGEEHGHTVVLRK
jgi:hypothetical protein